MKKSIESESFPKVAEENLKFKMTAFYRMSVEFSLQSAKNNWCGMQSKQISYQQ